ncbi:MAG: homoserine dehydrogenase [bacterium]|nr:homoserine dehydrogenase [bacterium]
MMGQHRRKANGAVRIGLLGCGTIGGGVARHLLMQRHVLSRHVGCPLQLVRVAEIDLARARREGVPEELLTTDARAVVRDPEIDIVVELIGGTGVARQLVMEAMRHGKHIVTANKALLAKSGLRLHAVAQRHGVDLFYEASVGGGIPIIKSLREGFVANKIHSVYGIVNGTCNYILTRMAADRLEFDVALKEAMAQGYAEADPSLDIEGHDARHKIGILASIAFGQWIPQEAIHVEGIMRVTALDIQCAHELGYVIKFLAIAKAEEGGLHARVHPTLLPAHTMLANVNGVYNAIEVNGTPIGTTLFYGRGAGRDATTSAVIADIVDVARNVRLASHERLPTFTFTTRPRPLKPMSEVWSKYYLRCTTVDRPGVIAAISRELGSRNIGLTSVLLHETARGAYSTILFMTHRAREADVQAALRAINRLPVVKAKTVLLRVEPSEE